MTFMINAIVNGKVVTVSLPNSFGKAITELNERRLAEEQLYLELEKSRIKAARRFKESKLYFQEPSRKTTRYLARKKILNV